MQWAALCPGLHVCPAVLLRLHALPAVLVRLLTRHVLLASVSSCQDEKGKLLKDRLKKYCQKVGAQLVQRNCGTRRAPESQASVVLSRTSCLRDADACPALLPLPAPCPGVQARA